MQICIFEDNKYPDFYPLSYSRPVYDLVCGARTLKEKIITDFPNSAGSLHCRNYLEALVKLNTPGFSVNEIKGDNCLFINGRVLNNRNLKNIFDKKNNEDCIYKNGEEIIAANLSGKNLEKIIKNISDVLDFVNLNDLPVVQTEIKTVKYIWDLIAENGNQLSSDIEYLTGQNKSYKSPKEFPAVNFVNPEQVFIGQNVTIKPGVVIDATHGPVLLDENAFVFPNAVIEGPV